MATFTHKDLEQARGTHEGLELAFERNIRQHSFKDEINGKTVETSIQRDHSGVWRALTVDGVKRMFDKNRDLWGQRQRGLRRLIRFAQHRKRCGYR